MEKGGSASGTSNHLALRATLDATSEKEEKHQECEGKNKTNQEYEDKKEEYKREDDDDRGEQVEASFASWTKETLTGPEALLASWAKKSKEEKMCS